MNLELIGTLIRLRYKLLWARTRTRNGKIALFMAGYLLLVLVMMVFALGGLGAGAAAVKSGKAELVARIVLGSLFLNAVIASVIMGFGMNAMFSEAALRRYPLTALERVVARHFIGIADPFWFLFLALYFGLAVGLYLFGAASPAFAMAAVLLLFAAGYLLARLLGALLDRLMTRKGGSMALLFGVLLLSVGPSFVTPALMKNPHALDSVLKVLAWTPPFGAAAAMTRTGFDALYGLGLILVWIAGLGWALAALENRPVRTRVVQRGPIVWETPWDRIGGHFGPRLGPLMAHWLRFYTRNSRFRAVYTLALPLAGILLVMWGRQQKGHAQLSAAISAFTVLGCIGTVQFAVNQFGHTGGGFRRLLLLPRDPGTVLRAGSYTFLLLSGTLLTVGTALFALLAPFPHDLRMVIMVASAGITSLLFMHGLALWATLYGARAADYYNTFGNDLSLAGNLVVLGGMLSLMFGPMVLSQVRPGSVEPGFWWVTPLTAGAAALFYLVSLERTARLINGRRETLLGIVEGKG